MRIILIVNTVINYDKKSKEAAPLSKSGAASFYKTYLM